MQNQVTYSFEKIYDYQSSQKQSFGFGWTHNKFQRITKGFQIRLRLTDLPRIIKFIERRSNLKLSLGRLLEQLTHFYLTLKWHKHALSHKVPIRPDEVGLLRDPANLMLIPNDICYYLLFIMPRGNVNYFFIGKCLKKEQSRGV